MKYELDIALVHVSKSNLTAITTVIVLFDDKPFNNPTNPGSAFDHS